MKKLMTVFLCGVMLLCFVACGENNLSNTQPTESTGQNDTNSKENAIFNTKNIKRITFYAYYGGGKGSNVSSKYMDEIITWLDSFTIDKEVTELIPPPGTNTIKVEIEYLDGTIVKRGLDTTTVDGITYYIKGAPAPECYEEIISKTSLN